MKVKRSIAVSFVIFFLAFLSLGVVARILPASRPAAAAEGGYIKWVDFSVPYAALDRALKADIETYENHDFHIDWIELLAIVATKNYGNWSSYKASQMDAAIEQLKGGQTPEEIVEGYSNYDYYYSSYYAVLGGFMGLYQKEVPDPDNPGSTIVVERYGLKAFSPIAEGYGYSHYRDFGNSRSYGYRRSHLGNDLLGSIGTPIVAVEGGIVEELGWNQYGGWRIGIRSFDGQRYYYYAHLRKDHPYVTDLELGSHVQSGDVIGYLGMTGYSVQENVNNMTTPHLHFGIQLIFDESQKDGVNQIWIDVYDIITLLERNRVTVVRNEETKDYYRLYQLFDDHFPISEE